MDTAAYRFDEGNLYEGDAPLSCAGRAGASGSSGASRVAPNPYGRDAWARPQGAGSRSARSAGSKTAQGASPQRRPSRGSARAFAASAAVPGVVRAMLGGLARTGRAARGRRIGRRRWHLWSVLSVAALSIFVLVAIFQMANLYVEGLGLRDRASPRPRRIPLRPPRARTRRTILPAPRVTSGAAAICPSSTRPIPSTAMRPMPVPRCGRPAAGRRAWPWSTSR